MKLSDYVANFIADQGIRHVFSVCGGGSMHLVNSVGSNERLKYVACHHEQGASIAAEAYGRLTGLGCALFTTGPGGTNSITGVACAWIDSIPVLYLSGQVHTRTLMEGTGLRQHGIQETDIVSIVSSITKYAVCVTNELDIRFKLEKAVYLARHGRMGPVWLDIPIDIQAKEINPETLIGFTPTNEEYEIDLTECIDLLHEAKRPLLIVGNGARGNGSSRVMEFIEALKIPVVTSWASRDMVVSPLHVGNAGLFGDRASNFAIQKADVVLSIGCRLSTGFTGHDLENFAKNAKLIVVDIDSYELNKPRLGADLKINCSTEVFVDEMLKHTLDIEVHEWIDLVDFLKTKYPVLLPKYENEAYVNAYYFTRKLSEHLERNAVVVLDVGVSYNCVYQAAKVKEGQRWINDTGHSTMGYAIPASIGAAFATGGKVVCLIGDGGFQMNMQELATIRYHNLPIDIFVFNNSGYLALKVTQDTHFKHRVGADDKSGLFFPDLWPIAKAYNFYFDHWNFNDDIRFNEGTLPSLTEMMINPGGPVIPKVFGAAFEDMVPYLPRDEFNEVMGR